MKVVDDHVEVSEEEARRRREGAWRALCSGGLAFAGGDPAVIDVDHTRSDQLRQFRNKSDLLKINRTALKIL